jgi:hypothetical protein
MYEFSVIGSILFLLFGVLLFISPKFKNSYQEFGKKYKIIPIILILYFFGSTYYFISSDSKDSILNKSYTKELNKTNDYSLKQENERQLINKNITEIILQIENGSNLENIKDSIKNIKTYIESSNLYINEKDSFLMEVKSISKKINRLQDYREKQKLINCLLNKKIRIRNWGGYLTFTKNGIVDFYSDNYNIPEIEGYPLPPKYHFVGNWIWKNENQIKIYITGTTYLIKINKDCFLVIE